MSALLKRLGAERPLLLDGATGTNLFAMGLLSGQAPELWNSTQPENIRTLHQSFITAGSDAILTNSFGGNARRLALHQAEDQVYELNRLAANLAQECAQSAERKVWVFGSVGPTGDLLFPLGELSPEDAEVCFTQQAKGLLDGGVDAFWIETQSSIEESAAAIRGIQRVSNKPIVLCMSFDTAGKTMMGIHPVALPEHFAALGLKLDAFGANCGLGPAELLESIHEMRKAHPKATLVAKSNYGIPAFHDGTFHYHGTPELMADYARYCLDLGVSIIGGCCGTTPEIISVMRQAIAHHQPRNNIAGKIADFIATNRTSPPPKSASTTPTGQPNSDGRSDRRSRKRHAR